uniref:Olfactory receptor 90 n=1 Tax=Aulacocentrum confusum TaxID=2767324 RepID=A0A7G8Z9A9_9HYME|nr:olfactory receptor 90 [Aulacocentrum confusum]
MEFFSKIACVAFNYNDLVEMHETLQVLFNELLSDNCIQDLIMQKLSAVRRLSSVIIRLIFVTLISVVIPPSIFILRSHRKLDLLGENNTEFIAAHLKALPAIYPWSVTSVNFFFLCQYFFEVYSTVLLSCVHSGIDSLFLFYIFQMMSELRAMSYRLEILMKHDDYLKVIRICVSKYQKLMRCRDILQFIYGPIIVWMLLTSAVVLCTLTFQMSQVSINYFPLVFSMRVQKCCKLFCTHGEDPF